jgi:hypothetical protein
METVSRAFSRLNDIELIAIDGKGVEIRSLVQLHRIIGEYDES